MNKWYFSFGAALVVGLAGTTQAQQTPPTELQSAPTKIIVIEEKVDRNGNKTVTKTVKEGNFSDEEINQIIEQESQGEGQAPTIYPTINYNAETGQGQKGYLGVMIEAAEGGVRITEIIEGSPAQTAGLQVGDVITSVDETATPSMEALVGTIKTHQIGDEVQVNYTRNGTAATVAATLAAREEPVVTDVFGWEEHVQGMKKHEEDMKMHEEKMKQHESDMQLHDKMMKEHEAIGRAGHSKEKPRFGVTIDDVEGADGVVVTSVYEGSLAEQMGLQEGDIITTFNGVEVNTPDALIEAVKSSPADKKVKVVFTRDGKSKKEKVTFKA